MEDTLKRLLNAEIRAETLVAQAQTEREQWVQRALQETKQAEQRFKRNIPQLQHHFLEQAEARAIQSVAELNKRYEGRKTHLRQLAENNQQRTLDAAVQLLMRVGQSNERD